MTLHKYVFGLSPNFLLGGYFGLKYQKAKYVVFEILGITFLDLGDKSVPQNIYLENI